MKIVLAFLGLLIFHINLPAQSQWKFHIAFEDGTGAKDTIWCIWDTTSHGTLPTDTVLGEGSVIFNYNDFNVWIYNYDNDSTKTRVVPFSWDFGLEVRAFNFQYPIIVTWDSSLFISIFFWPFTTIDYAWISNDYFFFVNNSPPNQAFNMLLDDHADAPTFNWLSQSQFPMYFGIGRHDTSFTFLNKLNFNNLIVYPNPTIENITIKSIDKIKEIEVLAENGIEIFKMNFDSTNLSNEYRLLLENLPVGFYYLRINNYNNQHYYHKFIKIH